MKKVLAEKFCLLSCLIRYNIVLYANIRYCTLYSIQYTIFGIQSKVYADMKKDKIFPQALFSLQKFHTKYLGLNVENCNKRL